VEQTRAGRTVVATSAEDIRTCLSAFHNTESMRLDPDEMFHNTAYRQSFLMTRRLNV